MIQEIIKAFTFIFIAEMGDKTQILAMAFATKYPVKKVLLGIFFGVLLNHGLAVILGSCISDFIPVNAIQISAGLAFIGFAFWTLKFDEGLDKVGENKSRFGPVGTVALAFFAGELGDKTQLTAITLACDADYPVFILCGTILGMVAVGLIGIAIGRRLGSKVPEFTIKIIAASVFMFFGIAKLYQSMPNRYLNPYSITIFVGIMAVLLIIMLRMMVIRGRQGSK